MRYLMESINEVDIMSFVIGYLFCIVILSLYHLGYELYKLWKEKREDEKHIETK